MQKRAKDLVPGDEIVGLTPDLEFEVIGKVVTVEHSTAVVFDDEDLDEPSREVPVTTLTVRNEKTGEQQVWKTSANRSLEVLEADDG